MNGTLHIACSDAISKALEPPPAILSKLRARTSQDHELTGQVPMIAAMIACFSTMSPGCQELTLTTSANSEGVLLTKSELIRVCMMYLCTSAILLVATLHAPCVCHTFERAIRGEFSSLCVSLWYLNWLGTLLATCGTVSAVLLDILKSTSYTYLQEVVLQEVFDMRIQVSQLLSWQIR